ncbi:hypothetical protein C7212DRAFT_278288 [Tuber magnatum]|uniref:Uncharacterized protein n=1 Tax=Tuber magnatum TaxID=42249 RepID=A0A317SUR3_9PEZI|nr:hypothetical protein C7212DRAFT_278288 [Tuber magnatum]
MSTQPLTGISLNQSLDPNTNESPSPVVQQLHQAAPNTNLEMQRQLLAQKLADKTTGSFTSPTDAMMTPCTKKLAAHKQKAYGKSQPRLLSKAFLGVAMEGKENQTSSTPTPASSSSSASGLGKNLFGADS